MEKEIVPTKIGKKDKAVSKNLNNQKTIKKSHKTAWFLLIIGLLIAMGIGLKFIKSWAAKKVALLEYQISYFKEEFIPMKFEITNRSGSKITLKTVFYDINGKKVGSKDITVYGDELNFEFNVINFEDTNYLFFPCGVYTDTMALNDSIKLFDAYDFNNFPLIYKGLTEIKNKEGKQIPDSSKKEINEQLTSYFQLTKNDENNIGLESHGIAVHDIKTIQKFQKGFVYDVVCAPHGGGIIIEKE